MLHVHVEPGQEIIGTLTDELTRAGLRSGAIVSVVGAVDQCRISTMPKSDAKRDIITEYNEPLEMFGSGSVVNGKPHIHAVFGREGDQAIAGHLHWATVRNWFVDVFIVPAEHR
jgi:predicted DNA-binding protein with PD1-like motif